MVKICEVVDGCEDCPKYGDDCDGDKRTEPTDYISRADAIEAVAKLCVDGYKAKVDGYFIPLTDALINTLSALPSADANQNNGRLINADALMDLLKARKQFFIDAYGGSFHCMSEKDKARCDEIDACIASIVNAPTVSAEAEQVTGKLKKPCDSLLTDDSAECKEQKSKLESADAVQGEWVDVENEPYCECSVCGSYIDNLDDDYAFCPRCGARMKGGAE